MTAPDLLTIGETMVLVAPVAGAAVALDGAATLGAGGAESNVAIAAATEGARTAWYSRVGAGVLGSLVVESVARHGVDTSLVRVCPGRPTGLMVKEPSPHGSRVHYYRAGSAASTIAHEDLDGLPIPRIVHTSGITAALSVSARRTVESLLSGALAPAEVSFDVNYRPALWSSVDEAAAVLGDLAARADVVFVGRDEAEALWGTTTSEQVRARLPQVPILVVKDGAVDAVEYSGDAVFRVPATTVDVIEPVGAGDAFAAGWLAGRLRGDDPQTRLRSGHAAAALVLRSFGDQAVSAAAHPTPAPSMGA